MWLKKCGFITETPGVSFLENKLKQSDNKL